MKIRLVDALRREHLIEVDSSVVSAGVILRQDTRMTNPLRAFRFSNDMSVPPTFEEVGVSYVETVPGDRFVDEGGHECTLVTVDAIGCRCGLSALPGSDPPRCIGHKGR